MAKLIKQQLTADLFGVAGASKEIEPLFTSLYNWGGIFKQESCGDLLDLGNPEVFQYFLIINKDYILGRSRALCNVLANTKNFKHKKGGVLKIAINLAQKEWDSIENERFLKENDEIIINPYKMGILDDVEFEEKNVKI